jgi:beta-glucanase (GH16 family)
MPTGNLPGWKQFLAQDFRGTTLPPGWGTYAGQPGGNQHGWWAPGQVSVRNGRLVLSGAWRAGRFTTGGVMSWAGRSTYGKYEVRFRAPKAYGVKYALLLWPSGGGWPTAGEIDFAEDGDGTRRGTAGTVHHGADNQQVHRTVSADFSTWQTVGVEWTPGKVVYTLNGKAWGSVVSPNVPFGPMNLALQLEAGAGDEWSAAPDTRTPAHVVLEVDWAVAYRRA